MLHVVNPIDDHGDWRHQHQHHYPSPEEVRRLTGYNPTPGSKRNQARAHVPKPEEVHRLTGLSPTPLLSRDQQQRQYSDQWERQQQMRLYAPTKHDVERKREPDTDDADQPMKPRARQQHKLAPEAVTRNHNEKFAQMVMNHTEEASLNSASPPPSVITVDTSVDTTSCLSLGDDLNAMEETSCKENEVNPKNRILAREKARRKHIQKASTLVGGVVGFAIAGPVGAVVACGGGYAMSKTVNQHLKRRNHAKREQNEAPMSTYPEPACTHAPKAANRDKVDRPVQQRTATAAQPSLVEKIADRVGRQKVQPKSTTKAMYKTGRNNQHQKAEAKAIPASKIQEKKQSQQRHAQPNEKKETAVAHKMKETSQYDHNNLLKGIRGQALLGLHFFDNDDDIDNPSFTRLWNSSDTESVDGYDC